MLFKTANRCERDRFALLYYWTPTIRQGIFASAVHFGYSSAICTAAGFAARGSRDDRHYLDLRRPCLLRGLLAARLGRRQPSRRCRLWSMRPEHRHSRFPGSYSAGAFTNVYDSILAYDAVVGPTGRLTLTPGYSGLVAGPAGIFGRAWW